MCPPRKTQQEKERKTRPGSSKGEERFFALFLFLPQRLGKKRPAGSLPALDKLGKRPELVLQEEFVFRGGSDLDAQTNREKPATAWREPDANGSTAPPPLASAALGGDRQSPTASRELSSGTLPSAPSKIHRPA